MNYITFFEGFLLGIGAAVPIGPINILIMNEALKSQKRATMIGLGAMSADITYLAFVIFGMITIFDNPNVVQIFGLAGVVVLGYFAFSIYKNKDNQNDKEEAKSEYSSVTDSLKIYSKGYFLTILNPYTIAFWLSVASYIVTKKLDFFLMLSGMFVAILSWIVLMPYFVNKMQHKISPKIISYTNLFSSLILVFFGISLLVHIIFS